MRYVMTAQRHAAPACPSWQLHVSLHSFQGAPQLGMLDAALNDQHSVAMREALQHINIQGVLSFGEVWAARCSQQLHQATVHAASSGMYLL